MYRLRRVYFDSIGHKDARFDPLLLDFGGDAGQKPLDSVIWLRNMGGKTSMLALIFSVLQPGTRDFLGREKAGEIRQLQKYVLPDDIAHVVLEWSGTPDGVLPGLEGETVLVTGVVMNYRRGQGSELDRHFYAFRAHPGALSLDELRFRASGRRVPIRAFLDQLGDAQRARPSLEVIITDKQSEWKATLESLGLDPEIFRYQLAMNEHEAGARKFLEFRDADSFVDFLIKVVMDPASMNQVAENLAQVADKLALEPQRKKEREFASGIITRLRPVADTHAALKTALERQQSLIAEGSRLKARIAFSLAVARSEATAQENLAVGHRNGRTRHDNERSRQERLSRELEGRVAQFQVEEAERTLEAAQEIEDEANREVRIWRAVPIVATRDRVAAEVRALDAALAEQLAGAELDIAAYRLAATRLNHRLRRLAHDARHRASGAEERARLASTRREEAETAIQEAAAGIAIIDTELGAITWQLQDLDQRQDRFRKEGKLLHDETAASAIERLRATEEAAEDRRGHLAKRVDDLESQRVAARNSVDELTPQIGQLTSKIERQHETLHGLDVRAQELSENQRLRDLAEHEDLDILVAGSVVAERLRSAHSSTTRQMVETRVAASEDERAKASLEETGLLPPSLDVERAVVLLHAAKIAATSGWQYVSEHVRSDHWERVASERPWLLTSVVVEPDQRERAAEALAVVGLDPALLVSVTESGEFVWVEREEPNGHRPHMKTILTRRALYDASQVEAARAQVETRLQKLGETEAELARGRDADLSLLTKLNQFMVDCPPGQMDALRYEIGQLEVEARRKVAQKTAAQSLVRETGDEIEQLGREDERLVRGVRQLTGVLASLDVLAELEERATQSRVRHAEFQAQREEWVNKRKVAIATKASARENESSATALTAAATAEAATWDQRAEAIDNFEGEVEDGDRPLSELEAEFKTRKAIHEEKTSRSEVAIKRRSLGDQLATFETSLSQFADVLGGAEQVAADQSLQDAGTRRAREIQAEHSYREAMETRVAASLALDEARRVLGSLPTDRRLLASLPPDLDPKDLGQARKYLQIIQERQRAAERLRDQAETQAKEAEERASAVRNRAKILDSEDGHVAETLGEHLRVLMPIEEPISDTEATERVRELTTRWRTAGSEVASATLAFKEAVGEVRRFASQGDFEELAGAHRDRYREGSDDYLAEHAHADIAELEMRVKWLDKELADLEGHRRTVVLELVTLVEQALRLLRDAQTLRLPEGLGDWAGHQYLRIKYQQPESVEDLKIRLQILVNELIAQRSRPEGISLLLKAVRAANGNKPFEVQVLKPNDGLRLERAPVGEIVAWSGGQKLTTAILIYCVLIRLRSLNRRGVQDNTDSVLVLDNPLGEANLMTLVDLQRTVAEAMKVQLIFATGIDDKSAMAPFRNVIRLRNLIDKRTGRQYVTNAKDGPETVGLAATRVYRRQEAISS